MDYPLKNMDFPITEWGSYRRTFPSPFRLILIDFVRQKRHWMRHAFSTCNFSLILHGQGEYHLAGRTWPVLAPCVLTQLPRQEVEYGPTGQDAAWDELFLLYDASLLPLFQAHALIPPDRPLWPIRNLAAVLSRIAELRALAASPAPASHADLFDKLAELLLLETHLHSPSPNPHHDDQLAIHLIERELASRLDQDLDLPALVHQHGLSLPTFRRRWAKTMSISPARYRLQLRLREACRLLTQTPLPIYQIARLVGFHDELYFSRRFHKELRCSPRAYRQLHQLSPPPNTPTQSSFKQQPPGMPVLDTTAAIQQAKSSRTDSSQTNQSSARM